jgi:hypothetical protein
MMPAQKKTNGKQFWIVVLGLFLVIGLVAGGTYVLNEQGLISAGGGPEGGPPGGGPDGSTEGFPDGPPDGAPEGRPDFAEGGPPDGAPEGRPDFAEGGERSERPDHHEGGPEGFSTQALGGLFKVIMQISVVVFIVAGGQWLFSWLQQRRHRAPAPSG